MLCYNDTIAISKMSSMTERTQAAVLINRKYNEAIPKLATIINEGKSNRNRLLVQLLLHFDKTICVKHCKFLKRWRVEN